MKVLLTGINGYIGKRLLPVLLSKGYDIVCLARDKQCFKKKNRLADKVEVVSGDLLRESTIEPFPNDIDTAYYVTGSRIYDSEFAELEALCAHNFIEALDKTSCRRLVFLNQGANNFKHTEARRYIERILRGAKATLTICVAIPYWNLIWPFRHFIFNGIANQVVNFAPKPQVN